MFHRYHMFVCVINFGSVPVRPEPFPAHPGASAPAELTGTHPSVRRHLRGPAKSSHNNVEVKAVYRLSLNQQRDQDAARTGTNDTVSEVWTFEELKLAATERWGGVESADPPKRVG